jgi:hypothetical protein
MRGMELYGLIRSICEGHGVGLDIDMTNSARLSSRLDAACRPSICACSKIPGLVPAEKFQGKIFQKIEPL